MPTAFHTPEEVSDLIAERMALMTKENGYETDVGRKLFRGRRVIDVDTAPCCVLVEDDNDVLGSPGRSLQFEVVQKFILLAYVKCDLDNPNSFAHEALRDLKRCIFKPNGSPDVNLGGQARRVHYLGHDLAPRSDGSALAVAAVEIGVEYVELVA